MSSSPVTSPYYNDDRFSDCESGYASADSSIAALPDVHFTKPHLAYLNCKLSALEPEGMSFFFLSLFFGISPPQQQTQN